MMPLCFVLADGMLRKEAGSGPLDLRSEPAEVTLCFEFHSLEISVPGLPMGIEGFSQVPFPKSADLNVESIVAANERP
jgi:hypothetical protein